MCLTAAVPVLVGRFRRFIATFILCKGVIYLNVVGGFFCSEQIYTESR